MPKPRKPAQPPKPTEAPQTVRLQALVNPELPIRLQEAIAKVRRQGVHSSVSAFVEIAVLELLERRDLADVLKRRGAKARRLPE